MVYARDFMGEVGTFVAVDVPNRERIGDASRLLDEAEYSITIDHHAYPETMSTLTYCNPSMAATSMLIWELSKCLRVDNSGDIALCAYTGLVTDTGRFQYQNADSRAFASASEMITAGVDASFVSREVYQNRSEASVLLEACSIKHMKLFCGGQAAISARSSSFSRTWRPSASSAAACGDKLCYASRLRKVPCGEGGFRSAHRHASLHRGCTRCLHAARAG